MGDYKAFLIHDGGLYSNVNYCLPLRGLWSDVCLTWRMLRLLSIVDDYQGVDDLKRD